VRPLAAIGLALSFGASACSPSVVIRSNDAGFARASARLARTKAAVANSGASDAEQNLFLHAESFYRYRFTFPPRSFGTQLAQAGAVVVELPALQALAGSLDLMDLRLRSYDAAVQLWETLLAEHPTSLLRPLALYRLGWAYRSAGVAGLPRESGDEAFALLARDHPASPPARFSAAAQATAWKSKGTATGLSIVPGLGQMYVGEPLNGSVRLAIALAAVAMIVVPTVMAYQRRDDLTWSGDWPLLATGIGGFVILSIDYTTAYQDALRGVVQFNERAEERFEDEHPDAP
jgi:hypothetical protein